MVWWEVVGVVWALMSDREGVRVCSSILRGGADRGIGAEFEGCVVVAAGDAAVGAWAAGSDVDAGAGIGSTLGAGAGLASVCEAGGVEGRAAA